MILRRKVTWLMVIGGILIFGMYLTPYRLTLVYGQSMTPTIRSGQILVVDRHYYDTHSPHRGDIVLFRHEDEVYIKRIHALAGDEVIQLQSPDTPDVIVNPGVLDRVYHSILGRQKGARILRIQLEKDDVYMLGDGDMLSRDSRDFGPVPRQAIIGKIVPLFAEPMSIAKQ